MNSIFFNNIAMISKRLKIGEISSVEITKQILNRIAKIDPTLNAFIQVMSKEALDDAKKADDDFFQGNIRSPLQGIPIGIKDIFETKGNITTAGSKILSKWKPDKDAVVVRKLKEAGAIIVGKTNLHEFAMGATTENPFYGATRNPWDLNKIPGGSSGGSAVAVATGMCYGALGTDTGGSIRLPSSLCGIVGLKPTYNLVDRTGCIPLSWSLDHIGPMGRTVSDCTIILKSIADEVKMKNHNIKLIADNSNILNDKLVKIGICEEYFFENIDTDIQDIIEKAIKDLELLGFQFVNIKIPGIQDGIAAQKIISKSEAYSIHKRTVDKYPEYFGKDVQFRLDSGSKVSAYEYIHAQRVRRLFISNVSKAMSQCDVLLAPTHSTVPFDIGQRSPEESINNIFNLGKTPIGNLLGYPILTLPCGYLKSKMPVGMQLIGKPYTEDLLLSIGKLYESEHNWTDYLEGNDAYIKFHEID